ncbi:hypothetical protein ABBQ38_011187 [Trebouxia sp. C0009 RCD-2024]
MSDFEFTDVTGQTLTKEPGSLNGESFVLKSLTDCTVYLLDYTSEVEVTDCKNCKIFIGPVDGPAIFNNCNSSQVTVACQQFQAKNCQDIRFGIYCCTQPSITGCSKIRIGCWMGAYPTLTAHFAAANLDPQANLWDKVYDISAEDGAQQSFEFVQSAHYWEVPISGQGPPENPVPAADGSTFQAGNGGGGGGSAAADSNGNHDFGGALESSHSAVFGGTGGGSFGNSGGGFGGGFGNAPMENGNTSTPAAGGGSDGENPKAAAVREQLRKRLGEQEEKERATKTELVQKAASYLEQFYERRSASRSQREKDNREAESMLTVAGPKGDTEWERALDYVNFGFTRPNGSDLSRMKGLLFSAKSKNVPVKSS